jgi:hypothetical protein
MYMNKWLYRAMGSVGVAGGMLLLGAGTAQAEPTDRAEPQPLDGLLAQLVAPVAGTGTVTAADRDGAVPVAVPLTGSIGHGSVLGGLQVAQPAVDRLAGLAGLPAPSGAAARTQPPAVGPLGLPAPAGDLLPALIGDKLARQGFSADLLGDPGSLPVGTLPAPGTLPVGALPLGALPVGTLPVGAPGAAGPLPIAGPLAGQALDRLPLGLLRPAAAPAPAPGRPVADRPAPAPAVRPGAATVTDAATRRPPTGVRPGERPIAGEDPEFAESAAVPALPHLLPGLLGRLTGGGVAGTTPGGVADPLRAGALGSGALTLPAVGDSVGRLGGLSAPLTMLGPVPVVGDLSNLISIA